MTYDFSSIRLIRPALEFGVSVPTDMSVRLFLYRTQRAILR